MTTLGKLTELWNNLIFHWVPSCKQTDSLLLKMVIEIVDLPINSMMDLSIVFCMFTRGYDPSNSTEAVRLLPRGRPLGPVGEGLIQSSSSSTWMIWS